MIPSKNYFIHLNTSLTFKQSYIFSLPHNLFMIIIRETHWIIALIHNFRISGIRASVCERMHFWFFSEIVVHTSNLFQFLILVINNLIVAKFKIKPLYFMLNNNTNSHSIFMYLLSFEIQFSYLIGKEVR